MNKVIIIGAGGHAQVVADILCAMKSVGKEITIVGYLDDNPELHGKYFNGYPVLGPISYINRYSNAMVVVAIGDNRIRKQIYCNLKRAGKHFFSAIHPKSVISPHVKIGPGTMICAGVIVNVGTYIGEGVILNTGCTIDHHNKIEDFVHVAPGAHLGGEVQIGEGTLIGIGAVVLPRVKVASWSTIGGGAVIIKDVPPSTTVVGNPGRFL